MPESLMITSASEVIRALQHEGFRYSARGGHSMVYGGSEILGWVYPPSKDAVPGRKPDPTKYNVGVIERDGTVLTILDDKPGFHEYHSRIKKLMEKKRLLV